MGTATDMPTYKQDLKPTVPESPRERIKRGRPLRQKKVDTALGPFTMREVTVAEKENAEFGMVQMEHIDGKTVQRFDSRGIASRQIATALINDDGSPVYSDPLGEGATDVGNLPRDVHDKLKALFDELNPSGEEAQADMGKDSAKATS